MKQSIGRIGLVMILSAIVMATGCADREEVSRELIKEGRVLLTQGRNEEAKEKFEKAASRDRKNFEAWFYLGNMRVTNREYEESIEYFERAIELKPDFARAWYNLGMTWFYLNNQPKACEHWKQAEALGLPNISDRTRHCP